MECGGCTLCCKLLDIPWMNSPAGEYCKECDINKGCKIYENAPKRCLEYQCAYAQQEKVSVNMRPDKCHVIWERLNDDVMIGLMESGYKVTNDIKMQMVAFTREGLSVSLSIFGRSLPLIVPRKGVKSMDVFNEVRNVLKKKKWLLPSTLPISQT